MVKKLRLMLDYHCYPVWLYDEDNDIIDTLLPEELRNDIQLDKEFDDLQTRFDALFIDDGHEFRFVGFSTEEEKLKFLSDWNKAAEELTKKAKGKYIIVDDIDLTFER